MGNLVIKELDKELDKDKIWEAMSLVWKIL